MRRSLIPLLVALVVSVFGSASARTLVGEVTKQQAIAAVRNVLKQHRAACGFRIGRISARRLGQRWRVEAVVSGRLRGTSRWVVGRAATPANALARKIRAGCPAPPQPPPPPAPPPPPPSPGAPATYVFGPELSSADQVLVRRGLDAGARHFRTVFGREVPPFTAWAYRDLEGLLRAYTQNEPISADAARRLWEGGQVGHATPRKVWLGPGWFASPEGAALKIAAHEAFHLLQYEIVGQRPLSVSSPDEIPRAGPWWLAEGTAERFAYLAIVEEGTLRLADVRAQWIRGAKATPATLRTLSTLGGQRDAPRAYDAYALAADLLLGDRDPKLVFAYYEAIARGVAWPEAFATTFGRSFDAFVDEFEAYKRGLP